LGQRSGLLRGRGSAINIYCDKCQGRDVDAWGEDAPITFCFRCGTKHVRYIETEPYRTIHAICPRCRPERAARYAAGDFAPLPPAEEAVEEAGAVVAAGAETPVAEIALVEALIEEVAVPVVDETPVEAAEKPAPARKGRKAKAPS